MAPYVLNVCCSLQSAAPVLESGVEANYAMWDLACHLHVMIFAMYDDPAHFSDIKIDEDHWTRYTTKMLGL